MSSFPSILLIVIAALAANLPFISERFLGVIKLNRKHLGWRLTELIALYFLVGVFARLLEAHQSPPTVQSWEFYVITFSLFIVFAFPGFVVRYIRGQRSR